MLESLGAFLRNSGEKEFRLTIVPNAKGDIQILIKPVWHDGPMRQFVVDGDFVFDVTTRAAIEDDTVDA